MTHPSKDLHQAINMNNFLFKLMISVFIYSLAGCSSIPTREKNPDKFDLLKTGVIKKANILPFNSCLVDGFDVKNRLAYNVQTQQKARTDGYRVESYADQRILLLSVDIFNSGKTQLFRVQNSSLIDLSQQTNAYDTCLVKYK